MEGSRAEGFAEGYAEGLELGKKEFAVRVIVNMFKQGYAADLIAECTAESMEFVSKVIKAVKAEQDPLSLLEE